MKKLRRKQKCGSDEDEVDSCVGIRIDRDKKNLAKQPESVLKVDCVNDTESEHNKTCTEKNEHTENLLRNNIGNRNEVPVFQDKRSEYHQRDDGRILECALTASVVIVSFLVTGTLSTIWYIQDVDGPKYRMNKTLFLFLAFPFSVIIRTLSYVKHGCLSRKLHSEEKKSFKHYQQMIKEDRDASLLRMFDAFIESVPQLIIQIYIALQHKAEESLDLEILRSITIASSLASLSWSVTSYYRNLRIFHATSGLKANSICGAVGYFLWRVFEIGPRITAIVMLLSVDSHGLYIIFGSFVQIISYMNLSHGKSRLFAIIYYTLFYVENVVMILLFVLWTDIDKSSWIFLVTICVASSGTLFCTLFMALYYKLCHPKLTRPSEDGTTGEDLIVQS
uniref:XK-related protein n=1 Tax=Magallana gigas TaxID=29159 RepID=A0A8W8MNX3_MAGGI